MTGTVYTADSQESGLVPRQSKDCVAGGTLHQLPPRPVWAWILEKIPGGNWIHLSSPGRDAWGAAGGPQNSSWVLRKSNGPWRMWSLFIAQSNPSWATGSARGWGCLGKHQVQLG